MFSDALLADLAALGSVIMIDIVLAGDNALVVGMAAAGLPRKQQRQVIGIGIAAALILRILFSIIAVQLLSIVGLMLAGGLLLLWVAWKMWREIQSGSLVPQPVVSEHQVATTAPTKSFGAAIWQITLADVSMSLDNVLAVAGAARDHVWMLVFGLGLSIALMGVAATFVAGLMQRYHWIVYIGLFVVVWVAASMIFEGANEIADVALT